MKADCTKGVTRGLAIIYLSLAAVAPANAFAPVAVLAAPQIVTAGSSYAVSAMAGLIGLVGGYLLLKDSLDNQIAVPLGTNSQNQIPVPSAAPNAQGTQQYKYTGSGISNQEFPSASAYCQTRIEFFNGVGGYCGMVDGSPRYNNSTMTSCSSQSGFGYVTTNGCTGEVSATSYEQINEVSLGIACPAGYTSQSGNCVLTNARQAVDDKRCDILLTNHQYSTAADMNCPLTVDGTKLAPLIRDGKIVAYGTNGSGQPIMWEVSSTPTQTMIKQIEQVQTSTQTQVKTTEIALDPATSTITAVQTSTAPGQIVSPASNSLPSDQQTTTDATNTPTVSTRPSEQVQPESLKTCGIPGMPNCAIDDSGFTSLPKPWESADKPDFEAPKKTALDNYTDPSFDWQALRPSLLPGAAVACTPLEFRGKVSVGPASGLDSTTTLDVCWAFEIIRVMLGYIFFALTLLYLWRTFISAEATPATKG